MVAVVRGDRRFPARAVDRAAGVLEHLERRHFLGASEAAQQDRDRRERADAGKSLSNASRASAYGAVVRNCSPSFATPRTTPAIRPVFGRLIASAMSSTSS